MSNALSDAAAYAQDGALVGPLTAAIERAAIAIVNEDPNTDGHELRKTLARAIVQDPARYVTTFAWATSTNSTVVGKWSAGDIDGALGDLDYVIATVWNAVAGV